MDGIDYTNKYSFNWISVIRLPDFITIDLKYKCNSEKIMTHKAARVIMGVVTQP